MEKQYVQFQKNQRLAYQVYGEGEHTLILLHGLVGGSWLGEEWVSAIRKANVCCIVPERPGYGTSSPIEMQNIGDWMSIVQKLALEWELLSADVIGCSAGAPYAYATALALPDVVERVWISAGVPAVYEASVLRHYKEEDQKAYRRYATQPQSTLQDNYVTQMEGFAKQVAGSSATYLKNTLDEILAQRCFGMAQESRLQILPWGLALSEMEQPVTAFHAAADEMVPYAAAKEMSNLIKRFAWKEIDTAEFPPNESIHIRSNSESFFKVLGQYAF